ncbi:hypothetical protein [Xanthocytophaga flava]|uniref:hypothetical protein n=1 Tax=Xanthocytophaga flava TaxID=3048013 RepID=UPI0028D66045|nr:hypothetical protein [Xanthocytophaga flavus]MDJ1472844.1 hypothetical protein [Xanthocytophaga flavus]
METRKNELPAELAESYTALIEPTRVLFRLPINQEIDLRSMTADQAALIATHHPEILQKKEKPGSRKKEQTEQ